MTGECIIGPRIGKNGYARLPSGRRGEYLYAHRVVWEQAHGPIPPRHHVHHRCGNKACVNLDHLELHTPRSHRAQHRRCEHGDEHRTWKPDGIHTYCRVCVARKKRERYRADADFRARHIAAVKKYQRGVMPSGLE